MKSIISASRRSDLPACHYDWLQRALASGAVDVPHPLLSGRSSRVDLRPQQVHSIVLWSKDYSRVAADAGRLTDYNLYFQYTINRYPKRLEPQAPEYLQTLRTLERLRSRYSAEQFNIRFDPLIFLGLDDYPARVRAFAELCRDLQRLGFSGCRITTSPLAAYGKVVRRLQQAGLTALQDPQALLAVVRELAQTATEYGFTLYSCAAPLQAAVDGVQRGACIDGHLLTGLFGGKVSRARDGGQRPECGCTLSRDIGSYQQPCALACQYCYARP